jgi:hypothetical protein
MQQRREKSLQRFSRLDSSAHGASDKYNYVLHGRLSPNTKSTETAYNDQEKGESQQVNHNGSFRPIQKAIRYASIRGTAGMNPSPENKLISLLIPTQRNKFARTSSKLLSAEENTVADDSESEKQDNLEILSRHSTCKFMKWVSERSLVKESATRQNSKLTSKHIGMIKDHEDICGSEIGGLGNFESLAAAKPIDDSSDLDIKDEQSDLSIKWIKLNSQKGLQTKFLSCHSLKAICKSQTTANQMQTMSLGLYGKALGH